MEDSGAFQHGGRRYPSAVGEQQAVPDQGQVDHDSIFSAVGEATSAAGQDEPTVTGKEQREEAQVTHTASAAGEEQLPAGRSRPGHEAQVDAGHRHGPGVRPLRRPNSFDRAYG